MKELYSTFLDERDPIISQTLQEAQMAKEHIMMKENYDATPEDQRGDMRDPGRINEQLEKSLGKVDQSTMLYSSKRGELYTELTTNQALDYHSGENGNLSVETPGSIVALIKGRSKKIKDLGTEGKDGLALSSLNTIDRYKIHGELNSRVEEGVARQNLQAISSALEGLAQSE
jgi:hypothetical protein